MTHRLCYTVADGIRAAVLRDSGAGLCRGVRFVREGLRVGNDVLSVTNFNAGARCIPGADAVFLWCAGGLGV